MPYLAAMLDHTTKVAVADHNRVAGSYDIRLRFAPDLESNSDLPTLFTALHETLGLELKAQQVPVETLVIDHVDAAPSPN